MSLHDVVQAGHERARRRRSAVYAARARPAAHDDRVLQLDDRRRRDRGCDQERRARLGEALRRGRTPMIVMWAAVETDAYAVWLGYRTVRR
jgi:hypothetical protein